MLLLLFFFSCSIFEINIKVLISFSPPYFVYHIWWLKLIKIIINTKVIFYLLVIKRGEKEREKKSERRKRIQHYHPAWQEKTPYCNCERFSRVLLLFSKLEFILDIYIFSNNNNNNTNTNKNMNAQAQKWWSYHSCKIVVYLESKAQENERETRKTEREKGAHWNIEKINRDIIMSEKKE